MTFVMVYVEGMSLDYFIEKIYTYDDKMVIHFCFGDDKREGVSKQVHAKLEGIPILFYRKVYV